MNLKHSLGRERKTKESDVNIIPVMNIFLLLIPFLLLTAAFVRLAVVELSLPSLNKGNTPQIQQDRQNLILIILSVKEDGFQLKAIKDKNIKFDPINKNGNDYLYAKLVEQLKDLKSQYPFAEDIIISPDSKVKYDVIIKVMDRCRESGFPNVSLSG